jgi:hypothetical protein
MIASYLVVGLLGVPRRKPLGLNCLLYSRGLAISTKRLVSRRLGGDGLRGRLFLGLQLSRFGRRCGRGLLGFFGSEGLSLLLRGAEENFDRCPERLVRVAVLCGQRRMLADGA